MCRISLWYLLFMVIGGNALCGSERDVISMKYGAYTYSLTPVETNWPHRSVYGAYRHGLDVTAGTDLHLFPDGVFSWVKWSDIGGSRIVGGGTYQFLNGCVTLCYDNISEQTADQTGRTNFYALGGRMNCVSNQVADYKFVLVDHEALKRIREEGGGFRCLFRYREYCDWKAIRDSYAWTRYGEIKGKSRQATNQAIRVGSPYPANEMTK